MSLHSLFQNFQPITSHNDFANRLGLNPQAQAERWIARSIYQVYKNDPSELKAMAGHMRREIQTAANYADDYYGGHEMPSPVLCTLLMGISGIQDIPFNERHPAIAVAETLLLDAENITPEETPEITDRHMAFIGMIFLRTNLMAAIAGCRHIRPGEPPIDHTLHTEWRQATMIQWPACALSADNAVKAARLRNLLERGGDQPETGLRVILGGATKPHAPRA